MILEHSITAGVYFIAMAGSISLWKENYVNNGGTLEYA